MPQLPIVPHGDAAALILPSELLASMGLRVGDTVDASIRERSLILEPHTHSGTVDKARMIGALEKLATLPANVSLADPVQWQREMRGDRPLPGRDN